MGALRMIPSALRGVSPEAWTKFVRALTVQAIGTASEEGYGCFAIRPRRLAELGLMTNLHSVRTELERQILRGDFIAPFTEERFLESAVAQYNVFAESIARYDEAFSLVDKTALVGTRSGTLAILHRGGTGALEKWNQFKLPATLALFERANGIF